LTLRQSYREAISSNERILQKGNRIAHPQPAQFNLNTLRAQVVLP